MLPQDERLFEGGLIFATSNPAWFKAWALDHDIPHKEVLGSYKGQRERAFFVPQGHIGHVFDGGWLVGEESALLLTGRRKASDPRFAFLVHLDHSERGTVVTDIEPLGEWREVSEGEALGLEAWTYDPINQAYFVAGSPGKLIEPDPDAEVVHLHA